MIEPNFSLATIIATFLAPILAIRAQKFIEGWREKTNRKLNLFHVLMSTRGYRLSYKHVEALNMIEIEYYDCRNTKGKKVLDCWKAYLDNLTDEVLFKADNKKWNSDREEKFIDMLFEMGKFLKYDFDKVAIKRNAYSPQAHGDAERSQEKIQNQLLNVLSGEQSISIELIEKRSTIN